MRHNRFLIIVALMLLPFMANAQNTGNRILATAIDSLTKESIEGAAFVFSKIGSKESLKYEISDQNGKVQLTGIPEGKYTLQVVMMGYKSIAQISTIKYTNGVCNLGTFKLQVQASQIKDLKVTAQGNSIIVKKDTIEYVASTFHTTESAQLEDLVKKMPGIEIASDGTITINGETVSKIRVNGKDFFADDPQVALKNLPANVIEKVKAVRKKSDQAKFTGIDDGEEEMVLDLSLKAGSMKGKFGNITGGAGYGRDDETRYQGGGLLANFADTYQYALLGNVNNTNNRGFRDIVGNAMRGMRIGGGMWGRNEGMTKAYMVGGNGGYTSEDESLKMDGNYMYNNSETDVWQKTSRENLLPNNHFYYDQEKWSNSSSDGHRAGVNLEYMPNETNQIIFRPRFNFGTSSFMDKSEYSSYRNAQTHGDEINSGNSLNSGDTKYVSTEGRLTLNHRFAKAGNVLSFTLRYNYTKNDMDNGVNKSETRLYGSSTTGQDSVSIVDQRYSQNTTALSLSGRLSYTLPVAEKRYIEANYGYSYSDNTSDKNAYNLNGATGHYDILDNLFSNSLDNEFVRQEIGVNYRSTQEKYKFTAGVSGQPAHTNSESSFSGITNVYKNNVFNFSPNARLEFEFSDTESLTLDYRGYTNQPTVQQLQEVPDNSNPLYVSKGNPDLEPEFSHNLFAMYRMNNKENFSSLFARMWSTYTTNRIINKSWYDEDGIRTSQPVNEGHSINIGTYASYNTPINHSKFNIGEELSLNYSSGNSYSNAVLNKTQNLGVSETLKFSYKGDKFNGSISGRAGMTKAWNTIKSAQKPTTWNNNVRADFDWTTPWAGISLRSDFTYNFFIGYADSYNQDAMIWNASIEKTFLKGKGIFSIKAYDILNQTLSIRRNTTDSYVEDVESNTLRQYFLASLIFRFGNFSGNQNMRMGMGGGRGRW